MSVIIFSNLAWFTPPPHLKLARFPLFPICCLCRTMLSPILLCVLLPHLFCYWDLLSGSKWGNVPFIHFDTYEHDFLKYRLTFFYSFLLWLILIPKRLFVWFFFLACCKNGKHWPHIKVASCSLGAFPAWPSPLVSASPPPAPAPSSGL